MSIFMSMMTDSILMIQSYASQDSLYIYWSLWIQELGLTWIHSGIRFDVAFNFLAYTKPPTIIIWQDVSIDHTLAYIYMESIKGYAF